MKTFVLTLAAFCITTFTFGQSANFHSFSAATIEGDTISMSQFYGKKILVVNTASFCSFTPQFGLLEQLYTDYSQYNFLILGFPCNDFGNQDPHGDSTIADFCHSNYNVTFQMMSKVYVVTGDTSDIYKWLQRADLNGVQDVSVGWNFNKFLIDEAGNWVNHYPSATSPLDTAITNWILSPSVVPTGLTETANANQFVLYPNPTTGNLTVQLSENLTGISVLNMLGQTVYVTSANSGAIQIDLSNQPKGMYFYRATGKNGMVKSGKFNVE